MFVVKYHSRVYYGISGLPNYILLTYYNFFDETTAQGVKGEKKMKRYASLNLDEIEKYFFNFWVDDKTDIQLEKSDIEIIQSSTK